MFERKDEELAPLRIFFGRIAVSLAISGGLILVGLLIGIAGYHYIAHLRWVDSILNASMILGGMGPVDKLEADRAKMFASVYALFGGLVFMAAAGILFSPILHRVLHKFHLDDEASKD